jgi:hypothetical protein
MNPLNPSLSTWSVSHLDVPDQGGGGPIIERAKQRVLKYPERLPLNAKNNACFRILKHEGENLWSVGHGLHMC